MPKSTYLGNDLTCRLRVTRNDEPENFYGKVLKVCFIAYSPMNKQETHRYYPTLDIHGNEITAVFPGKDQKVPGWYSIFFYENENMPEMNFVPIKKAFYLIGPNDTDCLGKIYGTDVSVQSSQGSDVDIDLSVDTSDTIEVNISTPSVGVAFYTGNDVTARILVKRNGQNEDFTGKTLKVCFVVFSSINKSEIYRYTAKDVTTFENEVVAVFPGREQKYSGWYSVFFYENEGLPAMNFVPIRKSFYLIGPNDTTQPTPGNEFTVGVDFIVDPGDPIVANITAPANGLSAYELAVLYGGFVGTLQEWLDSLKGTSVECGTTEYWNSRIGYIPEAGKIIVYTDHEQTIVDGNVVDVPGIKIGTGNGYVQDLVFIDQALSELIRAHINNTMIHVTSQEKAFWNNKLNTMELVEDETLIFNRN